MMVRKSLIFLICFAGFIVALTLIASHVSADTHTWDGGGSDALASTGDNWDQGNTTPGAGDDILIDSATKACTWDIADTFNGITMTAGQINITVNGFIVKNANIGSSAVVNIGDGMQWKWFNLLADSAFINSGTINTIGTGNLGIPMGNYDNTIILGTINGDVQIWEWYSVNADRVLKLSTSTNLHNVWIFSDHAVGTMDLDLDGNPLIAASITVNQRGIISNSGTTATVTTTNGVIISADGAVDSANINWVVGGNWDSSAGTWDPDEFKVNLTGISKTVKLGAAQTFYNLILGSDSTITQASDIEITNRLSVNGTLSQLTYVLEVSGSNERPLEANGTFDKVITITSTGASYTLFVNKAMTGTIEFSKDATFIFSSESVKVSSSGDTVNITMKAWTGASLHKFYLGADDPETEVDMLFTLSATTQYAITIDSVWEETKTSDGSKHVTFSHDSWSGHLFNIYEQGAMTITAANLDSLNFFRHVVNEGIHYWLNYSADQGVSWTFDSDALWLSWDGATIDGIPDYTDEGYYYADLTATNPNGTATVHVFIHVVDAPYGQSTSLLMDVMPVIVGLIIIIPMAAWFGMALRRKP